MKYRRGIDAYTNATKTNYCSLTDKCAVSYDWWIYLQLIGDRLVFNSYSYSLTTARHQSSTLQLLRDRNIKIDVFVECPKGLQDLESGIKLHTSGIAKLRESIQAPRSRELKNRERAQDISNLHLKILELRTLHLAQSACS